MLKVYHSNSLNVLRDVLVEMIAQQPLSDPFCTEQILVQSPGMAQWLKLELAQRLTIAANIDFPLPASFLWRTFSQLLVDVPERSAYSKESMTWVLMRILPEYIDSDEFQSLSHYMQGDKAPIRFYQLCEKIADLFDQYLVYRPDWIALWEAGDNTPAEDEQLWQPILWRAIVLDTHQREFPHWHRANMFDAFIDVIEKAPAQDIPQRLFVFGISALPDNYLQALVILGKRCDIHLMVANPCRQYWSDIVDNRYLGQLMRRANSADQASIDELKLYEQGNPLLASMGKLGRDYLHMLSQLELPTVELFNEDDNSHLLSRVQSDILSLRNRRADLNEPQPASDSDSRLVVDVSDDSISLHSCHSAMREVEVLQDQLLHFLQHKPSIEPRDIIVMMPDVSFYSPFVEAVFGQATGKKYLPFSISDRNIQQESPLIANFLGILSLANSRYGSSEILELLSLPALQRRLSLDEASFSQVRAWILQAGIKWGLDAQNREELSLPGFKQNSWQFGLDRMFAGFALGEIDETWQNIAPYSEIEGLDAASLGQLSHFVDLLQRCKTQFNSTNSIEQWIDFYRQLLKDLYTPDDDDLAALEVIYSALEKLQETIAEVHYAQLIPADIVIDYLQQNLTQQSSGQRFLAGQINFCTLMPMRAIPFKIVCLLGMNDGDYPRSVAPMGFDLMNEHSRKGDRSRRDDDRYLFLEALLSARVQLYISYIGRSMADNSHRAPSVLVSEIFEYIGQGYYLDLEEQPLTTDLDILTIEQQGKALLAHLSIEHPISAYHPNNFSAKNGLFSYAKQWFSVANLDTKTLQNSSFVQPLPVQPLEKLTLNELCSFFKQPIRYYFQQKLQVSFSDEESIAEDEEPFVLGGLDNYIVRDQLLQHSVLEKDMDNFSRLLSACGQLPLGVAGDKSLAKNVFDATELAEKVKPLIKGVKHRLMFDLAIDDLQFQGWIEPLYDAGVVKFSAANSSGRMYIQTWIEHLAACANGCVHTTYCRAINEQFHFRAVAKEEALQILRHLIDLYRNAMIVPLAWLPDLGWKIFSSEDKDKAIAEIEKNYNNFADPYLHRVFPKWSSIGVGLLAVNDVIFEPLYEYLVIDSDTPKEDV